MLFRSKDGQFIIKLDFTIETSKKEVILKLNKSLGIGPDISIIVENLNITIQELSEKNSKLEKHRECKTKYRKTMRARKQNLELVNTRVDKFSSPKFNKNPYLSEEKNMEILMAYYQLGHIKKDPRTNY